MLTWNDFKLSDNLRSFMVKTFRICFLDDFENDPLLLSLIIILKGNYFSKIFARDSLLLFSFVGVHEKHHFKVIQDLNNRLHCIVELCYILMFVVMTWIGAQTPAHVIMLSAVNQFKHKLLLTLSLSKSYKLIYF